MREVNERKKNPYRLLQQHLDRQPVGFPSVPNQSDLRILEHIFTPEEALVATCLSHLDQSVDDIFTRARDLVASKTELETILESIVAKGGIETGGSGRGRWYRNAPLVVGMYEYQLGRLNPQFIQDFAEYTSHRKFGISFLSTKLPQTRTIPIEKSIRVAPQPNSFDSVSSLLKNSNGPFAICPCICRKKQALLGSPCTVTNRTETCLAVGHLAKTAEAINIGRQVDLDEALRILEKNQEQGLVIQPSNTQDIDFICSCCGCCCGILRIHQKLPKPLDFWSANYCAEIDEDVCTGCGKCLKKCQVAAISQNEKKAPVLVDPHLCIGCGICIAACPADAVVLEKTRRQKIPPKTRDDLFEIIQSGKKGRLGQLALTGRLLKDALVSGRTQILK